MLLRVVLCAIDGVEPVSVLRPGALYLARLSRAPTMTPAMKTAAGTSKRVAFWNGLTLLCVHAISIPMKW
jgi:hypothetical protein